MDRETSGEATLLIVYSLGSYIDKNEVFALFQEESHAVVLFNVEDQNWISCLSIHEPAR